MTPAEAKALRLQLGLRQADLARYMGVDERSVKRWENGEYTRHPDGVPGPVQVALEWIADARLADARLEDFLRETKDGR